jgi:hypothetical protein
MSLSEKYRAHAAIALLSLAREALVAADREGPKADKHRLFRRTRPLCAAIEQLESELVVFADEIPPESSIAGGLREGACSKLR